MSDEQERKAICFSALIFCSLSMCGTTLAVLKGMGEGLWLSCSDTNHDTCASGISFPS